MLSIFIQGILLSGSMIIAIGSQNAFLLRAGLKRNFVFTVATICFLGDVTLMSIGVFGVGSFINKFPALQFLITGGGVIFLFCYGFLSLKSAFIGHHSLKIEEDNKIAQKTQAILSTLAITFLNPHVYLDTIVVVGGVAAQFSFENKLWFLLGTLFVSFIWFYGLGYAATKLVRFFSTPLTWRILDTVIAFIMFYIGFKLIFWIINTP